MKTKIILAVTLCVLALGACKKKPAEVTDYRQVEYVPRYATGFRILGASGSDSRLIEVTDPWQGADSIKTALLVLRDGDAAPVGFDGQVLNGEARRIVCTSSTQVALLEALGMGDRIVGVSGIDYITSPAIQAGRDSIGDIGYEGAYNYEALVAADPDLVLLYGVSGASGLEGKLRELRIPYMYVGEYVEESPTGKAEWLLPLAEVCGAGARGREVFDSIPLRYEAMRQRVKDLGADSRPVVMINTPYNDQWFMPSVNNYMARLVSDAGGRYAYTKNTGSMSEPIDMEEAYSLLSGADCWINTGMFGTLSELQRQYPKFADTPPMVSGWVYNNNLRTTPGGGNDFYESAIVRPDIVLRDLIKAFHPDRVPEDFVYYHRLSD